MKRVLLAFLLILPTAAMASPTALICLYKPLGMRFNLVNEKGIDMIQWDSNPFQAVILTVDDKYLTIKQYGTTATFKAVIDVKTLRGYGGIGLFSGEKTEGEIICATD